MDPELDPARLAELQETLGTRVSEIAATLLRELTGALASTDAALATGDLDEVALGAHAARNSALMIDARPMLTTLAELESAARRGDHARTAAAHRELLRTWPRLREQLTLAADPADSADR